MEFEQCTDCTCPYCTGGGLGAVQYKDLVHVINFLFLIENMDQLIQPSIISSIEVELYPWKIRIFGIENLML